MREIKLKNLDRKVKTGAVSYLNTKPLIYGFEQGAMSNELELTLDYPARVAEQLLNGSIDIGLVPVAVLPIMKEYHIVGQYCIGCNGPVGSVCLFSQVPVTEITTVLLDYQSRTSVALVQLLFREYWKKEVVFEPATAGVLQPVTGTTAAVIIGDRAFDMLHQAKFVYDLGEAWKQHTNMPFVFAVWAANFKPEPGFTERFNQACGMGFNHLPEIIERANVPAHYPNLHHYFTKNIQYHFGDEQERAMNAFLARLNNTDN